MAAVPIQERLARYGLADRHVDMVDLTVPAEEEVTIATANPFLAGHSAVLRPESIDDVKRWIGLPDQGCCDGGPITHEASLLPPALMASALSETVSVAEHRMMNSLAGAYVFGHTNQVNTAQVPAINEWLAAIRARINIFLFQDIYVAAGAKLSLAPSVHVLFARYITVEHTGRIVLGSGSTTSIDCAGFRGNVMQLTSVAKAKQVARAVAKS